MALINNLYVFVEDEDVSRDINSTTHPVEKGLPITDTIRSEPLVISLKGKIVQTGNVKASKILSKIIQLQKSGSLIKYSGRNVASNMQIQSFNSSHPYTNAGGLDFDMELKEVRIAKSAYDGSKNTGNKTAKNTNTKIEVGSIVIFKGGAVYKSSDAKTAAARRGRSTCKVTIISTKSYSVHQYHLISNDGGKVYGWVDKSNIETIGSGKTASTTKSGTQQVSSSGNKKAVYHTVKKGDTVWGLVNNNYKELGTSVQWVIDKNPSAFSRKGDARTLQVGKKLLMGYKQ